MYYGEIKNCDIANGEGVRVTLFVSGCTNRCKNCFQPQTWDFCYGQPFTAETEAHLLDLLSPGYISGLTLLGGDGRFVEELKDISLRFRGSSNQRLLDLNATRASGTLQFLPDREQG